MRFCSPSPEVIDNLFLISTQLHICVLKTATMLSGASLEGPVCSLWNQGVKVLRLYTGLGLKD